MNLIKHAVLILVWGVNILMLRYFFDLSEKLCLFIFFAGLMVWLLYKSVSIVKTAPLLLFAILLVYLSTIQARNDRDWLEEVSRLPSIQITNNHITIGNFRDFTWQGIDKSNLNWEMRTYDLNKLEQLYLYVVPFHGSNYMAHTMLGFEFQDQGTVIVSVETRKEKGEDYSLIAGALRQLELVYVFGSEKDLLTLRAVHRGTAIHLYPIKAETDFIVNLFKDLAQSANSMHVQPQFYRTLRDNCTTTLVKHIDRHYQQKIGLRIETIFPAKAGELLYKLDRMDSQLPYAEAYEASRVEHLVKLYANEDNFSALLHANAGLLTGKNLTIQ